MKKLEQLNSILVKELKDSKNEIAKLKGENEILKEKYEKLRDNIKKLISPEDIDLKNCHSSDDDRALALPEITNEDVEIIPIKEEEELDFFFDSTHGSNAKYNFNSIVENPHKRTMNIIDTLLNPSDEQSIAVEKFDKLKYIASINKSIEETNIEIKTEETIITNASPIRPFDAMNFRTDDDVEMNTSNDFLLEKFGSSGSKNRVRITVKKSLVASKLPKHDMEITCPICEKKLTAKKTLKTHIKDIHEKLKKFKCGICAQGFAQKIHLHRHQKIHAAIDTRYKCKICAKSYSRQDKLKEHVKIHHYN